MQTARILGVAHATVQHDSFRGQRLVLLQPLAAQNSLPDGPPMLALDAWGSRRGDLVIITSDGIHARELTGHSTTPARWSVAGILDPRGADVSEH